MKIGSNIKWYNEGIPRTKTSTSIDRDTDSIYAQRNSNMAGKLFTEDDLAPPVLIRTQARKYNGKMYL